MRIFEESKELEWAMTIINRCIRRGAMVRLVDRSNPDFSVKLDREMDLVIADMINNDYESFLAMIDSQGYQSPETKSSMDS